MIDGKKKIIVERVKEPSTWAGLATLLVLFNVIDIDTASELPSLIAQAFTAISALLAIFMGENKK